MSTRPNAWRNSTESTQQHHAKSEPQSFLPFLSGLCPPALSQSSLKRGGGCKGTPLTPSEITSDEPLLLLSSSTANRSSGITSAVLLIERTAEALPMTADNCWKTSDIPLFLFVCLFFIMT
jgi:hypothetical protein